MKIKNLKVLPAKKQLRFVKYTLLNKKDGEYTYPFYASYKITNKCTLRCHFCNVWQETTPILSTQDVFKVLDNIGNSSITVLSMEGGDPLIRPDLLEILKYASTKPFYLFFTTNGHLLDKVPIKEYVKYIDFLHISIDEGHGNVEFFERLKEFQSYGVPICIQIVVTKDTLYKMEEKVKRVYEVGARTVIMPAVHLSGTEDVYPNPEEFRKELLRLKEKYKNTIITTKGFLDNINKPHGCSTSSIIIDTDGSLFYPCRTLAEKTFNLLDGSLMEYLKSDKAKEHRARMKACNKRCGWYQYFATDSFVSPKSIIFSLKPYIA